MYLLCLILSDIKTQPVNLQYWGAARAGAFPEWLRPEGGFGGAAVSCGAAQR